MYKSGETIALFFQGLFWDFFSFTLWFVSLYWVSTDKVGFQGSNKATSSQGVQHTYDFLFDRHLKVLTTMDQDEEELYNEDHLRAIGE